MVHPSTHIYQQAIANITALIGPRPDPQPRIRYDTPDHEATNAQFRAEVDAQLEAAREAAPNMSYLGATTEVGIRDIAMTFARYDRRDRAFAWDRAVKAECARLQGERLAA